MTFRFLIFGLLISASTTSFSQILRVDKSYLAADSVNFLTGAADLRFSMNNLSSTPESENTFIGLDSNLDLVYLLKESAFITINQFRYFKPGNGSPINNGSTHLRFVMGRKKRIAKELFTQLQYDESRQMQTRFLVGAGVRVNLNKAENTIFGGLGTFYETEVWQQSDEEIVTNFLKLNSYIGGDVDLNDRLNLHGIVYYQTGYDADIEALRNRFSLALEFRNKISEGFLLKTVISSSYDQRPIIDVVKLLYSIQFGVEFKIGRR